MRLSTRGEYASRAMLELSLHYGEGPLHIRDISAAQGIPERFLEQILLLLKRAGYLRSRKGKGGGYILSRPPAEINVAEVIRVMDGPLAPIDCVSVMAHQTCPREEYCGLRGLWKEVRDTVAALLERTTFEDLVKRQVRAGGRRPAGRGGEGKSTGPVAGARASARGRSIVMQQASRAAAGASARAKRLVR